ncbi:MAG: NUDIX hydrolase [Parachlamydiaceae bacterium]|nr:NUDIX hydrolase [Parachlamydiaceae bacterium]
MDTLPGEKFLTPTFQEGKLAFQGVRFDVRTIKIPGKNDTTLERDVVVHPGAVVILPILDDTHIVMIRNERFAVGKELWELPAGTLDRDESPINTASRELIEETGYQAKSIQPLSSFYTSPGICNEAMYAFVANDLVFVGQALEESEKIVVELITWKQALEMIKKGIIIDAKTITTLLYYHLIVTETQLR